MFHEQQGEEANIVRERLADEVREAEHALRQLPVQLVWPPEADDSETDLTADMAALEAEQERESEHGPMTALQSLIQALHIGVQRRANKLSAMLRRLLLDRASWIGERLTLREESAAVQKQYQDEKQRGQLSSRRLMESESRYTEWESLRAQHNLLLERFTALESAHAVAQKQVTSVSAAADRERVEQGEQVQSLQQQVVVLQAAVRLAESQVVAAKKVSEENEQLQLTLSDKQRELDETKTLLKGKETEMVAIEAQLETVDAQVMSFEAQCRQKEERLQQNILVLRGEKASLEQRLRLLERHKVQFESDRQHWESEKQALMAATASLVQSPDTTDSL